MLFIYPAIFHRDEDAYWVEFPDLDGCLSDGDDEADAFANAQEALTGYILSTIDRGLDLPKPSSVSDQVVTDGFATLVSASLDPYLETKAIKKTLTIPQWMNDKAVSLGINFSQVLQEALLTKIQS